MEGVSAVEALAGPPGTDVDLVQIARRRMLQEGWALAVVLTDLPIHVGHRPVTAHISVNPRCRGHLSARPRGAGHLMFNVATALTIALGILAHYAALFVLTVVAAFAVIAPAVLASDVHHQVGVVDYLGLAWLVTTLGTVGGALGTAVESDRAVREAAYGYRAQEARQT